MSNPDQNQDFHVPGQATSQPANYSWDDYYKAWDAYIAAYPQYEQQLRAAQAEQLKHYQAAAAPTPVATSGTAETPPAVDNVFAPEATAAQEAELTEPSSQLRSLIGKLHRPTWKKHLKPVVNSLLVGLAMYAVFNSQLIIGQLKYFISPGASAGSADLAAATALTSSPIIIIPKVNVNVPVVYDVKTFDESAIQSALQRGVVHYGTTAVPGQKGNTVIVGHSSNNWWASGKYKFAFVLLSKLEVGDTFYIDYKSIRYTYEVTNKRIIEASDVSILKQDTSTAVATLVTCDPPGTSWHRLALTGKQVSPDPSKDAAPTGVSVPKDLKETLPGAGESFWTWLKHLF